MRIFFLILLIIFNILMNQALALQLDGSDSDKLLTIKYKVNSTEIYIPNYQNKQYLFYQADFLYPDNAAISLEQEKSPDLLSLIFPCGIKHYLIYCTRFFNRRTSQLSDIYQDLLDYNAKQNIVAYYIQSKNLVVLSPLYKKCDHPLTYNIGILPGSIFGIKTQFLSNGDLQLDYANPKNELVLKVLPINYQQIYKNCGLKPPYSK